MIVNYFLFTIYYLFLRYTYHKNLAHQRNSTMNILPSHPMYEKVNTLQLILCMAVNRAPFSEFEHMPEKERLEFVDYIKSQQQVEFDSADNQGGLFSN